MKLFLLMVLALASLAAGSQTIPRPEHPRPDMVRREWLNLNGPWEFAETDDNNDMTWAGDKPYPDKIIVPFCRESKLSGLSRTGFVKNVWYRRKLTVPKSWKSKRILLHIGACDWTTTVWLNGKQVAEHTGGQAPITADLTAELEPEENTVVIHAFDDTRSGLQALGKQCTEDKSFGCLYTRTTGIWQTVWLEGVGDTYMRRLSVNQTSIKGGFVGLDVETSGPLQDERITAEVTRNGKKAGTYSYFPDGGANQVAIVVKNPDVWAPGKPNLYDVKLTLKDRKGKVVDTLTTYVAFRDVSIKGRAILLNYKPVFQRLVLDQGFYPTGIWTAPSDDDLKHDIEISMAAGFNGARLHQKVFEPRYLYWADKLGYMVWGEYPNWGLNYKDLRVDQPVMDEWKEIIARDTNHPSIVGWCPFNETPAEAGNLQNKVVALTRKLDPSRPIIDTSGYIHSVSDPMVMDTHDYDQNPESFKKRYEALFGGISLPVRYGHASAPNVPYMVSEYGGIGWDTAGGWGYGEVPKTLEEFYVRFKGLSDALLDNPNMFGFCYTQITDVEQEHNGIYKYDRTPKFDVKRLHAILSKPAAIEKGIKPTKATKEVVWKVLVGSCRDKDPGKWKYTTDAQPSQWTNTTFDDSAWLSSSGGFGDKGGFESDVKTSWKTSDIWLRKQFKFDGSTIKEAALAIHFDNAAEVYVNGSLVWKSAAGAWNDGYDKKAVTAALQKAMHKGSNVIAVHCHQDSGGQFIDLALLVR